MKTGFCFGLMLLFISLIAMPMTALGQSASFDPRKDESIAAKKGFKTRLFEIKHRDPRILASVLSGLGSKENGSLFDTNAELKTIIVRDYPEIIASVEDALNRLDQPEAPVANFEIQLHLIATSRTATDKSTFPPGLDSVLAQLQSTLKYTGYRFITTFLNRVKDNGIAQSNGSTDLILSTASTKKSFYQYGFNNVRLVTDSSGKESIQVRNFSFQVRTPIGAEAGPTYSDFSINTELGLREGEMVVVGTTNIGSSDEAIIVVVSMKKVR